MIIEGRAKVYESPAIIHVDKIQQHPENNVGVDFPNIIHLIKTGQHYDLLKQTIDVDDLVQRWVTCAIYHKIESILVFCEKESLI